MGPEIDKKKRKKIEEKIAEGNKEKIVSQEIQKYNWVLGNHGK